MEINDIAKAFENCSDLVKEAVKGNNDAFWNSLDDVQKTAIKVYFRDIMYGAEKDSKIKFSKKEKDDLIAHALMKIAWDKRQKASYYCKNVLRNRKECISYLIEEAKILEQEAEKYAEHRTN